jgi:small subunit ribosomal protein S20e
MSYVAKGEKEYDATGAPLPTAKLHKIRITLTSSNVKNLEKCMSPFAHVSRESRRTVAMQFLMTLSTAPRTSSFA